MKRYETRCSACSSTSRLRMAACTETSSAEVGSSQTTSFGSPAKARAIATRCLSPPESCTGFWVSVRSVIRTRPASSRSLRVRGLAADADELLHRAEQDALHRVTPVERRVGILEDDLDRAQIVARALLVESARATRPRARRRPVVGRHDAEQRSGERRLAAARLADEPERLARPDRGADADERMDSCPALLEDLPEVVDLQQRLAPCGRPPASARFAGHLAREAPAPGPGGSNARGGPAPARSSSAPRCGSDRRRARSGRRRRSPGSRRRGSAGSPGSCRGGPCPCGRRRAGCSAGGRPCTGGADPGAPSRPGPSSTSRPA